MNKEIEEKIIKQRENYIYKILLIISVRSFFWKISYDNNNIDVLFTNYHIINDNLILIGKK